MKIRLVLINEGVFPSPIFRLTNLIPIYILGGMLLSFVVAAALEHLGIGYLGVCVAAIQILGFIAAGVCAFRIRQINGRAQRMNLDVCIDCLAPIDENATTNCMLCSSKTDRNLVNQRWKRAIFAFGSTEMGPRPRGTRVVPWWTIPIFMLVSVASLFLVVFIELQFDIEFPVNLLLFLLFGIFLLGPLLVLITNRRASRLSKRACQHDFLMCEFCRYPLGTVSDSDVCPECGSSFDRYHLRRRWYELYGAFHTNKALEFEIPIGTCHEQVNAEVSHL
ncbi:MAG: hypothetical protein KDA31_02900 [Phycisphaerales bacterium]|nr:hypothetical protein [Phycisphaerales bacterium]